MRRMMTMIVGAMLALGLAGCAGKADSVSVSATAETTNNSSQETTSVNDATDVIADDASLEEGTNVLVVYFSATGTTKEVAEKIAGITNADIYEITPMQEYTSDDLNWHDESTRATREQNDSSARPEIANDTISLDGYDTVYIGYPIWWGEEPRIMDTFVESHAFDGMNVIPFCTSGSSGIGRSGKNLAENAGSGNWLDGKRFGAGASQEELAEWIDSMK